MDTTPPGPVSGSQPGSVRVRTTDDRTRIVLAGEIDVSLAGDLADAVGRAELAGNPTEIDAAQVAFMDSSGIALLARVATRTPGRLAIISPPDVVRFLLEVTRIGDMVDVLDIDPGFPDSDGDAGPSVA
ncbi:anti-sigma-factor antagonist [Beutenbergia cavernae DSM 12333]|uniref:Anti-sigma-factor antagonist n=1 Tax=Beutenbergia cavernae (strain ATCC BAA-8 / DSM 12333 / CCUG 43141 / JCM 11478 / NBRC 16432 / NCIMB 13614 / HKI 0122) TaxID=471853 RepID=C5C337_BEUC1|nr:STAS domain-containing protein [Beutenbergia cavernae]ACQ81881.1 anti-sigma-factor antagonist [Beutenbergia cavernae DSM 12333]